MGAKAIKLRSWDKHPASAMLYEHYCAMTNQLGVGHLQIRSITIQVSRWK